MTCYILPSTPFSGTYERLETADSPIMDKTWLDIKQMVYDDTRYVLWVMEASGRVRGIHIHQYQPTLGAIHTIPELLNFPPGVTPIFIDYLGYDGHIDHEFNCIPSDHNYHSVQCISIHRRTGNLFFLVGFGRIVKYDILLRSMSDVSIDVSRGSSYDKMSPVDIDGRFLLWRENNFGFYCWNPDMSIDSAYFLSATVGIYSMSCDIIRNRYVVVDRYFRILTIKPSIINVPMSIHSISKTIYPDYQVIIHCTSSEDSYIVTRTVILPIIWTNSTATKSDRKYEYDTRVISMSHCVPVIANGFCNGQDVLFNVVDNNTSYNGIRITGLPHHYKHKRRKLDRV
jgi:hypothetical protein